MSFTINNKLSFIDSFQFLSSSLDSLVKNSTHDDFKCLSQEFDNNVLDLFKQKIFYFYEYMSDFEKFEEEWPSKEKFYSSLTDKKNNDKEYEHVLNVWNKFEMKIMKDYRGLYLKCDLFLLADMIEKHRNNNFKNYGLCPSDYLSAADLSGMQSLKWQKLILNLFQILTCLTFFEKSLRGGTSYISNRYSKANNKHLKSYNQK